jgi:hypothetical protein
MAIRIPILTSFDPKGLKQANAQFAKLGSSVNSLGRNFAVAGVAIGAIGAGLAKTVQTASSYAESVNAVNVAFGKSAQGIIDFGKTAATTLGVSQVDFNNAAVRFSAFAERIVGSGGDASKFIAEISTRASDFASVFNIEVSEALQVFQSGLAGEAEPLKRFGINLLDTEVKAYAVRTSLIKQGETMTEQQKVIARYGLLMEETAKTSGDFANTSDGLANQMRILKAEVSNTQIEIGNQLLPVMAELLPIVRDLVSELGTQLVAAVKAVDWKALTTDIMNTLSFFIKNATAIAQLTVAVFAINTAFKAFQVISGIVSVALSVKTWWLAKTATGMTNAAVATGLFSTALKTIPFVAIAAGLGLIGAAMLAVLDDARLASTEVKKVYEDTKAELIANPWKQAQNPAKVYIGLIRDANKEKLDTHRGSINQIERSWLNAKKAAEQYAGSAAGQGVNTSTLAGITAISGGTNPFEDQDTKKKNQGSAKTKTVSLAQTLKKEATLVKKQTKLVAAGVSEGLAARLTSTATPVKRANKALNAIAKNNGKLTKNLKKLEKNLAAAAQPVVESVAFTQEIFQDTVDVFEDTSVADALAASVQAEADALAERERVYNSFLDSVKSTFANIKNSILGAFDLTQLGGSANAITRNMDKLLVRLRSFSTNVAKLSGMGLNSALLQQVISAGPMAGARLAESLVMGGTGALAAINAGYSEFGNLAGQIATTGTNAMFGSQAQQTVYNINVDGGVGSGATIGKAIVDAIKAYERTSGAVWQGA